MLHINYTQTVVQCSSHNTEPLTLILLTWKIGWAPNNARKCVAYGGPNCAGQQQSLIML